VLPVTLRLAKVSSERARQLVLIAVMRPEWEVVQSERKSRGKRAKTARKFIKRIEAACDTLST
jgi:hypothetical protein